MARKGKNKPPKTDNNPSGENVPDKDKDVLPSDPTLTAASTFEPVRKNRPD